jgi:uncharacterized protein DUF3105
VPSRRRSSGRSRLLWPQCRRDRLIPFGFVAKKKTRVPTPPRPVQAPKKRTDPRTPRDPRRTRIWLGILAAALVVVGGGVAIAMAFSGDDVASIEASGVCKVKTAESQGRNHVNALPEGFKYNSVPPTSGPHSPQTAIWGVYDEPVDEINLVHNREHGGVIVQYGGDVPKAQVDRVIAWYRDDPNGVIVAPLTELRDKIALTAWTKLASCSRFDEEAFSAFREEFRFKGPERVTPESMTPGNP